MIAFDRAPASCIIGIDPGVKGAIAFLDTESWRLGVIDMPTITVTVGGKDKTEQAPSVIAEVIRNINPMLVVSEKLQDFGFHPNPHDLMTMGRWRGQIEGIVASACVGFEHPSPSAWKAKMGLTSSKEHSRTRANMLFPLCAGLWKFKKDHDRAEAACLALFGCFGLGLMPKPPIKLMAITIDQE